jgi:hypothetical protein
MPEHFERELREGTTRFGERVTPPPVHLVRARGDRRRRRRAAATVALAVAIVAGGGGAAYALSQPGHPGGAPNPPVATGTPRPSATPRHTVAPPTTTPGTSPPGTGATSPPAGTTTLQLGNIVMQVPDTWRVTFSDGQGGYTVSTGSCAADFLDGGMAGSPCPSFSVIANMGPVKPPAPNEHSYDPPGPYITSTGVVGCPGKPDTGTGAWLRNGSQTLVYEGFAPVTTTKTADYDVWQYGCRQLGAKTLGFYFQQRDWYLPVSRILIVDEYSIPALPQVLATATWR